MMETMERSQIIAAAQELTTSAAEAFVMSTVTPEGRPHVFWMGAMVFAEPFVLYMETYQRSRKVAHLKSNPNVELLLSRPDFSRVLTITGKGQLEASPAAKKMVFDRISASADYFSSAEDPNLAVIKVVAEELRLWTSRDQREPFVAVLGSAPV